jgi:uncharacterized protein YndB with AHSA1/START domain
LIKRFIIGFAALLVVLVLVSQVLPGAVHVERRIAINAAPEVVFPFVNSPRQTEEWSPWLERDRNAALKYEGPDAGVGAKLIWRSDVPEVGAGTFTVTESKPNALVRVALTFEGHGDATAYHQLTSTTSGTIVVWGFDVTLSRNPVERYFGLFFDSMIGADYERGLANLKNVVERIR